MKILNRVATSFAFAAVFCAGASSAFAAGKKPQSPTPNTGCTPGVTPSGEMPKPIRRVTVLPVATKPFNLPNGSRVEMQADLDRIVKTAVLGSGVFKPTESLNGSPVEFCGKYLEIEVGVSEFMLNAFELGINIGYTPTAEGTTLTNLTGKTKLRVGSIAMEFQVYERSAGSRELIAASTASALTAGVNLSLEVDFGLVTTGTELAGNPNLADILRGIMGDGMKKLARSADLDKLSWKAQVREYFPEIGTLIFDAGAQSNLKANQAFTVFALNPSVGACNSHRPIAHIHTTQIEMESSTAIVDQVLDSRGIHDGDFVLIRPLISTPAR